MKVRHVAMAILLCAPTSAVRAQFYVDDMDGIVELKSGGPVPMQMGVVKKAGPAKTTATPPQENQRLNRLKAMSYDRRPSAILKAWSTPNKDASADENVGSSVPVAGANALA